MKQISFKNLSLKYKISFAYSLAVALIFAVGGAILFSVMKHNIETGIENELKNTTSALMNMVRTSADISVKNYLRGIAEKNWDIVQNFYSQYQQGKFTEHEAKTKAGEILLTQTIGKTGYIFVWNILKAPGSVILDVHPKIQGQDVAHVGFVQEGIKLKNGYMEYEWKNPDESHPRKKAMYLAYFEPWEWIVAISSYREEFKDMVNVRDFRENVISHRFGKTGYAFVSDYYGTLLVHQYYEGKNFSDEKDAGGRKFIAEMCMKKKGRIIYPWKNSGESSAREKLTVFNDIPEFGWIVGSSVYLDELYEPLDTVRNLILFIGFIAMFIVFPVISMRISSYITGSLKLLMKKLALVSDRDFSVRMKICSEDEIGQMAGYFNNFMEQLEISAKKLSESEKKYRDIFENAVEGIFQSVPGGGYLSVNSAYAKIFGYDSPQEVLSSVSDVGKQMYVNPEDREKLVEIIKENGMAEGFETQLYRKDKSIMWVSVYARSVSDNQGNLLYYEGSFIDITDRRRAEAALRESETKFKSIYENTYDTIMLLAEKGFFDCNRRTLKMFGFGSKDEFINIHPSDISPPYQPDGQDSVTAANERIQTAVEKGHCFFEWMHRRKNGEDFPADVILSSYLMNGEKIVQATVRDISERKAAERVIQRQTGELRESEEKYRSIFDNALEGIFQSTPEGRFIKVNPSLAKIHGTDSPEEMITSVTNIGGQIYVDPESREELGHKLREHGYVQGFETQMYRKDKSVIWVSMNARCVRDSLGNILFYEGFVTDITHRKQSELELKKYQEHLEEMVEKRTAELAAVLAETRIAREAAEQANKKITDSLNYAKLIQSSLLANMDVVKTYIPNSFFIWEPRDIVGGDIFFTEKLEDGFVVAVVDCTGHGVPGAFMTMIASSGLKKIIRDEGCHNPAEILKRLSYFVKTTLHQDTAYAVSDDGMDAGIVRVIRTDIESPAFGLQASELTFAGAKIPLYYVHKGEVNVIAGDKKSIGYRRSDLDFSFSDRTARIEKGTAFYMATDGFADQLGADSRRFGTRRFRELLKAIAHLPFEKQREIILEAFEAHRGKGPRQDDVTVAGFGF